MKCITHNKIKYIYNNYVSLTISKIPEKNIQEIFLSGHIVD